MNTRAADPWRNAQVFINGTEVPKNEPILLLRGQSNRVQLIVSEMVGKTISLNAIDDENLDIEAEPKFGAWVLLDNDAEWELTQADAKSGYLRLVVLSRDVVETLELDCRVMSSDLADEADVLIGGNVVPPSGIDFTVGSPQVVTLRQKPNSPLAGYPVKLKCETIEGDLILQSQPDFDGFQTEHRWSVTGESGSGSFRLSFAGQRMTQDLVMPDCRLRNEEPSIRFIQGFQGEDLPLPPAVVSLGIKQHIPVHVRCKQADGSPMVGLIVSCFRPGYDAMHEKTDYSGVMYTSGFTASYTGLRTLSADAMTVNGQISVTLLVHVKNSE